MRWRLAEEVEISLRRERGAISLENAS
jgi:hypothetical protein